MSESPDMNCAKLAEVATELALGVLTGRERAEAVAHLARCDACREDVRQLMETSVELVGLLPASEPPAGFETRVLDRLGLAPTGPRPADAAPPGARTSRPGRVPASFPQPGRKGAAGRGGAVRPGQASGRNWGARLPRSRRLLAAAAVALAVVGAGVGGWGLGVGTSQPAPPASGQEWLSSAAFLTASHQNVGELFVYQGSPRWLYMSVDLPAGNGTVTCQVVGADGTVSTVGAFRLAGGYGAWGSPDPGNLGGARGAQLVAPDGTVLARATFN